MKKPAMPKPMPVRGQRAATNAKNKPMMPKMPAGGGKGMPFKKGGKVKGMC